MHHLLFSDPVLLITMETVVLTDVLAGGVSVMVELEMISVGIMYVTYCLTIKSTACNISTIISYMYIRIALH